MGFSINSDATNKRIRLIPKSTDAASDLYWSKGAITEDAGEVSLCLAPRNEVDTAFLIHVPVVYYSGDNGNTKAYPFSAIEINGVSHSLEGIPDLNGSNLRDLDWQGFVFPPEVVSQIRISCQQTDADYVTPSINLNGTGYGDEMVFFRNRTDEKLDVKLITTADRPAGLQNYYHLMESDGLNETFSMDSNGNISFTLYPRNETAEDWFEATVKIESFVANWGSNAGQTIVDSLYFEIITGDGYSGERVTPEDYFEVDFGDGTFIKYVFSEYDDSDNWKESLTYYYREHQYATTGEYKIRVRSTFPLEYIFIQDVKEVKQWGRYLTHGMYGLGYRWSADDAALEKIPATFPKSISWYSPQYYAPNAAIDVSGIDPKFTVTQLRAFGNKAKFIDFTYNRTLGDAFAVWGDELAEYDARKIPLVHWLVVRLTHGPVSGSGMVSLMECRSETPMNFIGPTRPDNTSDNIQYVHDELTGVTTYLLRVGEALIEDLNFFGYVGWNEVNSGRVTVDITGYLGAIEFDGGDLIGTDTAEQVYSYTYNYKSTSVVTPTGVPMETFNIAYDGYVGTLIPHNSILSEEVNSLSLAQNSTIPDQLDITGTPGSLVKLYRYTTDLDQSTEFIYTLNDQGKAEHIEPFYGGGEGQSDGNGRVWYHAMIPGGATAKGYIQTLSTQIGDPTYHIFDRQMTAPYSSAPMQFQLVNETGEVASDVMTNNTTPVLVYTDKLTPGNPFIISATYTSPSGNTYTAQKTTWARYIEYNDGDGIVFELDKSRGTGKLIEIDKYTQVYSRILTVGEEKLTYTSMSGGGAQNSISFSSNPFTAESSQIQRIEIFLVDYYAGKVMTGLVGQLLGFQRVIDFGRSFQRVKFHGDVAYYGGVTYPNFVPATLSPSITDLTEAFTFLTLTNPDDLKGVETWDTSNVTVMQGIFARMKTFNSDITGWDVSNVTNFSALFSGCESFNQDISNWNVSNAVNMSHMFAGAKVFDQPIGNWDVSKVTNFNGMFSNESGLTNSITGWDMSKVTNMYQMFNGCPMFNQPIGTWNISKVTNIAGMFKGCTVFNQPLGAWNTSKVTEAAHTFYSAEAFNQNLSQWCVLLAAPYQFAYYSNMTAGNLPVWGTCPRGENLV